MSAATPADASSRDWRSRYANRLLATDSIVIVVAVFTAQFVWFGNPRSEVATGDDLAPIALNYWTVSIVLVIAWILVLGLYGSRSDRVVGIGASEYRAVVDASVRLFGVFAIAAFLLQIEFSRGYFILAFPLGTIALLVARRGWRQWLRRKRDHGEYCAQVLLVGSEVSVLHTARELMKQPHSGYTVVGACVPSGRTADYLPGTSIPVAGSVGRVVQAIRASVADTVIVTSSDELSPQKIRELSWALEPGRQHLVMAPSLTDIGGPRIHTRPVAGLPLVHVEMPSYDGYKKYQKRALDILGSGLMLVVLLPVLVVLSVGIRVTSAGSISFLQERVGLNGATFSMVKFRSMVQHAESQLDTLRDTERDEGNDVLFKMKNDPRVTGLGRFLRRYSLDELPQLLNVFVGQMSLVGPRPPLVSEVSAYESHVHRRFMMKPGITGLWQVSGRSDLSWEDSVRLDLYYVENWSMVGDFVILARTAGAVMKGSGAY
ncbi:MAG: polyprenyl glycosylphosphotransferase [Subtercola sp.]|nr:polyprenyl glycosylphosphotransferase [Subtercola sp.]